LYRFAKKCFGLSQHSTRIEKESSADAVQKLIAPI